jgi:hypothetical protein
MCSQPFDFLKNKIVGDASPALSRFQWLLVIKKLGCDVLDQEKLIFIDPKNQNNP